MAALDFTGERFIPGLGGAIKLEHLHRYALCRELVAGKRVLDIASGEGYGSALLSQWATSVIGVDVAPSAVEHAAARYAGRANLSYRQGSCEAIPLPDASIDVVVSFETIEHHDAHEEMMREIRRVLIPGGLLVISSPDKRTYSDLPGYRNPYHIKELYFDELRALLEASFRNVRYFGQRVGIASMVAPIGSVDSLQRALYCEADTVADGTVTPGDPVYFLGLCSDAPLAEQSLASSLVDTAEDGLKQLVDGYGGQAARADELQRRLDDAVRLRAEAAVQADELQRRLDDAVRLRAEAAVQADELQRRLDEAVRHWEETRGRSEELQRHADALNAHIEMMLRTERDQLRKSLEAVFHSHSWRITAPLRALRQACSQGNLISWARLAVSRTVRYAYRQLPLSIESKLRIKGYVFRLFSPLLRHTAAYKAWLAFEGTHRRTGYSGTSTKKPPSPGFSASPLEHDGNGADFVPLSTEGTVDTSVKLIAFYLPQYYPIPENDEWWGKGFTDWLNVAKAKPRFVGHYQPHLPGELGFYDLRLPEVQARQIELAKLYGVYGFCFYYYWFAGRKLLERPLTQLIQNPNLDFPFCLCWANENWSRRRDGRDSEVLIAQHHSPEDDLAFIASIVPALRDPRYIRIGKRPLLLVYRPSLLPQPRATAERWRSYCRETGVGEIFLASTHAFDAHDPTASGFDAAVEFPPNNTGAPVVTEPLQSFVRQDEGIVYDYRFLVEMSRAYENPGYTLFRGVMPSWDNEARRNGRGRTYLHSSPRLYRTWLENACRYTVDTLPSDQRFVFVNAWNEWAEGCHLEPDQRFGYAYLQATADALRKFNPRHGNNRIVCVSHDAYRYGAQLVILNIARVLSQDFGYEVHVIVAGPGPLFLEFERYAHVYDFSEAAGLSERGKRDVVRKLYADGSRSAFCNTSAVGSEVRLLKEAGFAVLSLVHEMPWVIQKLKLEKSIESIARFADAIVFPAEVVRRNFESLTSVDSRKTAIRPQGLYMKNPFKSDIPKAREMTRRLLGLRPESRVVLAVAYGDWRKGFDIFVSVGLRVLSQRRDVCFTWIGEIVPELLEESEKKIAAENAQAGFRFPGRIERPEAYFAGCDLYLLPSREDPFPSVLLSALDAGLPAVGFEGAGGFDDLLRSGAGLLVPDLSESGMARAVLRLLGDGALREQLGSRGRELAAVFDFRDYVRDILELLRNVSREAGFEPRTAAEGPSQEHR